MNLSPDLLSHTLAGSLQDRLHDVVSDFSTKSEARLCTVTVAAHCILRLCSCIFHYLGSLPKENYSNRKMWPRDQALLLQDNCKVNKGPYNICKFYRHLKKKETKLLS